MIENRNFEPSCDVCDFSRQRTIRGTRLQISTRVIMGEHDRARADFESTGNDDPGKRLAISDRRSEEHTSELQSLMRISYAVFCLKKNKIIHTQKKTNKQ